MRTHSAIFTTLLCLLSPSALAQDSKDKAKKGGIAWYGTWKQGLSEAKKSGRPILLVAAAPHCHNISGMW